MPAPPDAVDVIAYSDRTERWVPITVVPSRDYGSYVLTDQERDGRPVAERDPNGTHRVLEFGELVAGGYRDDVPPPDENGDWPEGVPVPPVPSPQLEPGIQAYGDTLPGYTWIDNPRSGGGAYATEGPSTILLHMTVSMGLSASYVSRHPYPPHCWANPYTGDKWQTVSLDRAAYALYQPASSRCWTNREGYTIQTELVGVPVVNQETYNDGHLRWIAANVVVPQAQWLASVGRPVNLNQVAYRSDSSGSASEYWGGRLSEDEWENYNGLCQHSVIPYNDHWDCSVERLDLIAQYAREIMGGGGGGTQTPKELFTVAQYDDIMGKLGEVIVRTDWILKATKKCRMITYDGGWYLTDFINVVPINSVDAVVNLQQFGYLDNDVDASGNPIPQGCTQAVFDTLNRLK